MQGVQKGARNGDLLALYHSGVISGVPGQAASTQNGPVQLHPNPPRLVTVVVAVVLAVVGVILAWPIEQGVTLLQPIADVTKSFGLALNAQTGYLCLFAS